MKTDSQYLYDLLPAYHRLLDNEQGEPLKALVQVLAREAGIVEDDITRLYENWFIETCDEWMVPYIGDLLGVRGIHEIDDKAVYSRRAYVANTLGYRRRKGTASVLEQLALDTTGWKARVVEFFQLLIATQHLNHIRLHSSATPDLRQMNRLDLLDTAFDSLGHTVHVGRIASGLGKHNISNIGLYLWRLQSYPLARTDARKTADRCYTFHPAGLDTHLFNRPKTESGIKHLAEEINMPGLLRRHLLHDELESRRQALAQGTEPNFAYFDNRSSTKHPPVFELSVGGNSIPPEQIVICNLNKWQAPPPQKTYKWQDADGADCSVEMPIAAAVDPVLGRIVLTSPADEVVVSYSYGFSGDVGGGPYDRRSSLAALHNRAIDWQVGVSRDNPSSVGSETIYPTLHEAIAAWNNKGAGTTGLILIMDSRSYDEGTDSLEIKIPEGSQLFILAAEWPVTRTNDGIPERKHGAFRPENVRPHLLGNIKIEGTAPEESSSGGGLVLNGLLIEGNIRVSAGNLQSCAIDHCTLVPGKGGLEVSAQSAIIQISLDRSIGGSLQVGSEDAVVYITECILDHIGGQAIDAEKSHLDIRKSTVFGKVSTQSLEAGNCIFNDALHIARRQTGCVRFSYLPLESVTPRRFRCQPELEIQARQKDQEIQKEAKLTPAEKHVIQQQVLGRLFPVFNAVLYGHHAYCQLGTGSPRQITAGADNAAEMGVFNHLQQAQRETNLRIALEEYLPLGLEAGIVFAT
jgi:hypothetical protein